MRILFFLLLTVLSEAYARDFYPLHSHNDYLQKNPLKDALDNNFQSVEADVWLSFWGNVKVAHMPWQNSGLFEEIYLKPLQEELDQNLFPYWRGHGFVLWIDLKDPRPSLLRKLARMLEKYPMVGNDVEVVMTGLGFAKRKFARNYPHLSIQPDSDNVNPKTLMATNFTWYALDWGKLFKWNGQGEMPLLEREKLVNLVQNIHAHNKKIRFFSSPDTLAYWKTLKEAAVDLINTDHPAQLAEFWKISSFSP